MERQQITAKFPHKALSVIILFFKNTKFQAGQAAVEFSLVALLFFALIFAIVEFSHLFYTRLTLQHALREAGRFSVTGQGFVSSDPSLRVTAIQNKFCQSLIGTGLSCANITANFSLTCPPPSGNGCSPVGGGPGDTVVLTASFTKPWFTGFFGTPITFTLSTTWRNEPSFS